MKPFTRGQRVAAVIDGDIASCFGHGPQGTVHRYDPGQASLVVDWDTGIRQTVPADTLIRLTSSWVPAAGTGLTWEQTLAAARAAGAAAGRDAADWWCQTVLPDLALRDAKPVARHVLQAIDDDPGMIDGLPLHNSLLSDFPEQVSELDVVAVMAGPNPDPWPYISTDQWAAVADSYRLGYDDAMLERVGEQCRLIASPTGDGRDLSHLHPRHLRPGRYGVFSGEWHLTDDDGPDRYRIGFAGILIGTWNGWAVFACDRHVAEQVAADHTAVREADRTVLQQRGLSIAEQDHELDRAWGRIYFDGDVLVVDQRVKQGDPQAIQRSRARPDSRWVIRDLCWDPVDPADCDRIIGDLPAAGAGQASAPLPEAGLPHPPQGPLTIGPGEAP